MKKKKTAQHNGLLVVVYVPNDNFHLDTHSQFSFCSAHKKSK